MDETGQIPVFREQMVPATVHIADCLGLAICFHLSTLEAGLIPDPPLSPIGTHSPALESFTDTVFLILLVIIGDGLHDNTIMGNS